MIIDLTNLRSGLEKEIQIDTSYSFSEEELKDSEIISLNDVSIKGNITYKYGIYEILLDIAGEMILPCSISLKPVKVPFSSHIEGNLEEILQESLQKLENSLDILPIIWENILMEIPLKVVSDDLSDVKTSGDGWKLITEEEEKINPELEKLRELL